MIDKRTSLIISEVRQKSTFLNIYFGIFGKKIFRRFTEYVHFC